jgi:hypothetical protein
MTESNWVKAEDLALDDWIRFREESWGVAKKGRARGSRKIEGRIVNLAPGKATLSTSRGFLVKRITAIERGKPERLERRFESEREPKVYLREPKRFVYYPELDPMVQAIAKDNEREEREQRQ